MAGGLGLHACIRGRQAGRRGAPENRDGGRPQAPPCDDVDLPDEGGGVEILARGHPDPRPGAPCKLSSRNPRMALPPRPASPPPPVLPAPTAMAAAAAPRKTATSNSRRLARRVGTRCTARPMVAAADASATPVCVSLVAPTAAEQATAAAAAAAAGAGMVEFRLDRLQGDDAAVLLSDDPSTLFSTLASAADAHGVAAIATARPRWEDPGAGDVFADAAHPGDSAASEAARALEEQRVSILCAASQAGFAYVDVELDAADTFLAAADQQRAARIVVSSHDFEGTESLDKLRARVARMWSTGIADVAKVAQMAHDAFDASNMLTLLADAAGQDQPTVALSMGPAGLCTRILAPVFGGAFTFAALDDASASAPGQVSVDSMVRLYRTPKLNADSRVFAVAGSPVSHSKSPLIHNSAFAAEGVTDAVYVALEIPKDRVSEFLSSTTLGAKISGMSVTIPHKEEALALASDVHHVCASIGAANTLVRIDGGWYASNTDWVGVVDSIDAAAKRAGVNGSAFEGSIADVLGAGGAAKAAVYGAIERGASKVRVFNRTVSRAEELVKMIGDERVEVGSALGEGVDSGVLLNTTSVGMVPDVDASPVPDAAVLPSYRVVFDAVYTPRDTRLLRDAEEAGCAPAEGIDMFVSQAVLQYLLFTGRVDATSLTPLRTDGAKRIVEQPDATGDAKVVTQAMKDALVSTL